MISHMGCEYPNCGNGRQVGGRFCGRHYRTPFYDQSEINAYRRGIRDERRRVWAVIVEHFGPEALILRMLKPVRKGQKTKTPAQAALEQVREFQKAKGSQEAPPSDKTSLFTFSNPPPLAGGDWEDNWEHKAEQDELKAIALSAGKPVRRKKKATP